MVPIFAQDTSSTTGAGLGSLVYNTASLAAKWRREGDSSWTTITLATATAGTFTSGGFIADGGPVTGGYEVGIPDAALAAGKTWAQVEYYGATNMLPVLIEFELDAVNYQSATAFITGVNSLAPPAGWNLLTLTGTPTIGGTGTLTITGAVATQAGTLPITTSQMLLSAGTGTGQLDFTSGVVKANATQWLGGTIPAVNVTGVPLVDAKYLLGTIFSTPATAGVLDINIKNIGNAALSASTAQLGVNVVNFGGSAGTFSGGRAEVNTTHWSGTINAASDTAGYPKVTHKSGSGTGELDITSGVVKANLAQILGTALTETAGLLAGGFKKFFNIATPTNTLNDLATPTTAAAAILVTPAHKIPVDADGNVQVDGIAGSSSAGSGLAAIGAYYDNNVYLPATANVLGDVTGRIIGDSTTAFVGQGAQTQVTGMDANVIVTGSFAAGTTIPRVTLADTVTTYTGNTPQTGDSFSRIGATGSGLTSLAQASLWTSTVAGRIDAAVSSRMATYTQPTGFLAGDFTRLDAAITSRMATYVQPTGFLAASFPASPAAVGSAMTLASAYDPAKTAASATNLAAVKTVVDGIATKFVGMTSLPAWIKAIFNRKTGAAQVTALNEMNS